MSEADSDTYVDLGGREVWVQFPVTPHQNLKHESEREKYDKSK